MYVGVKLKVTLIGIINMIKAAQKVKARNDNNPLFFAGELTMQCICQNCGGAKPLKKASFYKIWNNQLYCSICKK